MKSMQPAPLGSRRQRHRTLFSMLDHICDQNFRLSQDLIGELSHCKPGEMRVSAPADHPPLRVEILVDTPYTRRLRFSHEFETSTDVWTEPHLEAILYLDAKVAEVKSLDDRDIDRFDIEELWRVNVFWQKWLLLCLEQGHSFPC